MDLKVHQAFFLLGLKAVVVLGDEGSPQSDRDGLLHRGSPQENDKGCGISKG